MAALISGHSCGDCWTICKMPLLNISQACKECSIRTISQQSFSIPIRSAVFAIRFASFRFVFIIKAFFSQKTKRTLDNTAN
jgi:hypothetical protein